MDNPWDEFKLKAEPTTADPWDEFKLKSPASSAAPQSSSLASGAKKFSWANALSETWPARLISGLYEGGKRVASAPGEAVTGEFAPQPQTPGALTEEDVFRQDMARQKEAFRGAEGALFATPVPAAARAGVGWLGVPKGLGRAESAEAARTAAASRDAADEFSIPLSRGQATGDLDAIRYEDMAARGAYGKPAQERAAPFFERQFQSIQEAGRDVGSQLAREGTQAETPNAAASMVNAEVAARAAQERAAAQAAQEAAEREAAATHGMVDDQGRAIGDVIARGHLPVEGTREAGEIVGHELRASAARDRRGYQQLYDEARDLPGQFHAGAFEGIGNRIQGRLTLGDNPVIIDDVTTPVASRAIRDLDQISHLRIQNRADPFGAPNPENIAAVDLRGVDQARKRLVVFYRNARSSNNAADVRATGRLIDEFDNMVEQSIANGLFSGDPRALGAIQQARAAYSRYARTYRPQQAGDDVGMAMRRIIDRNATPEEIANMIAGSERLTAGLPVRIAERLEGVLGRDSDGWSAIRQAVWQRAAQSRNPHETIAQLANSSLGRRLYEGPELRAMLDHAQGIRDLGAAIERLPATEAATRAQTGYQQLFSGEGIGGQQATVFRRIVDGVATPEETMQAVFGAIGSGNPGNASRMVGAIERIVGPNSDAMAAIRQGVWQRLTQNAAGKDQPGQQKIVQSINEFLNGRGQTIAQQLYSPDELALMRRYATVLRGTIIPKYARTNSDTAPALMAALHKLGGSIMTMMGIAVDHSTTGGLAGYGVSKLLQRGAESFTERRALSRTGRHIDEPVPEIASQPAKIPFLPPSISEPPSQRNSRGGRVAV